MAARRRAIAIALCTPLFALVGAGLGHGSAATDTTITVPADVPTIQGAINAAGTGDTVLVSPGRYRENIDFLGKAIALRSVGGPAHTIIDGSHHGSVVTFHSGETPASVIEGFTIQGGAAASGQAVFGGGVAIVNSSPTVVDDVITKNQAEVGGAGISVEGGAPLIEGDAIVTNKQTGGSGGFGGGGIMIQAQSGSAPQVIGNLVSGNSWNGGAGGVAVGGAVDAAQPTVEGNVITGNVDRQGEGGGLTLHGPALVVQNLVAGNQAVGGAGVYIWGGPTYGGQVPERTVLVNNTVTGNSAEALRFDGDYLGSGIGLYGNIIDSRSGPAIDCNTEYVDALRPGPASPPPTAPYGTPAQAPLPPNLTSNDVFGGASVAIQNCGTFGGSGDITADPLFAGSASGNYRLTSSSPAIGAGDSAAPSLPDTDLAGNPRTNNGVVDQGAYAYSVAPPGAVTGLAAVRSSSKAALSWTAPDVTGGGPVTSYTITASGAGSTLSVTSAGTAATVKKLKKGVVYRFTVVAVNQFGASPPFTVSG